ncbi:magnesium/cobalt transporter CorA [Desulfonatronovibrio hydrogenovorans]|uniref:magnesium/cobalt transporter CorA n=1 Tax=Desulfonatronovibrio hydrogenovorans TaxID=53245 RepID=UPI00048FAF50|nr:magnesium/cobalt transporter CorA [Desulfonatronovibrio hydrogenovorans]
MSILSKKTGTSPGSLVYIGQGGEHPVEMVHFSYDLDNLDLKTFSFQDVPRPDQDRKNLILVFGVHEMEPIRAVGQRFQIHPLILEDIVNTKHRPKLDRSEEHIFLTMKTCLWADQDQGVRLDQVSFILTGSTLVCFLENRDVFPDEFQKRLAEKQGRLRSMDIDYTLYALMDLFVDNFFLALEKLEDQLDLLEEEMVEQPREEHLQKIFQIRRTISAIRQTVWPMREILSSILSRNEDLFGQKTRVFFRDLYDHCQQIMDSLELQRELNTSLHEVYLSLISHRMNTVMKLLTIIATIFIPLTFIAGIYGMNFEYMPELSWPAGYFICLGFMAAIGLGLVGFFKLRRWF